MKAEGFGAAAGRLDHLLGRIGSELDGLAAQLAAVGVAGDGAASRADVFQTAEIVSLQNVDQVEQTLRDLAAVLRRLMACPGASVPIDVARLAADLPLARTAALVLGRAAATTEGGHVELF